MISSCRLVRVLKVGLWLGVEYQHCSIREYLNQDDITAPAPGLVWRYTYKEAGHSVGLFNLYPDSIRLRRYSGLKMSVKCVVRETVLTVWPDARVGYGPSWEDLPENNTKTPDVRPAGVELVLQTLRGQPLHWHWEGNRNGPDCIPIILIPPQPNK